LLPVSTRFVFIFRGKCIIKIPFFGI
jgi:hypothetical protein